MGRARFLMLSFVVCACGLEETGLLDDGGKTPDVQAQDVVALADGAANDATTSDVTNADVVVDAGPPDVPSVDASALCASTCPNLGGVCLSDGTCHFDCTQAGDCT